MRAFFLLLAMISVPAQAADQFDLVCSGDYQERINAPRKPLKGTYRIDLDAKSWCSGACDKIFAIEAIEPGKIILSKSDPNDRVAPYSYHEIDRVSGKVRHHISGSLSYWDSQGTCEALPFSGFPKPKF